MYLYLCTVYSMWGMYLNRYEERGDYARKKSLSSPPPPLKQPTHPPTYSTTLPSNPLTHPPTLFKVSSTLFFSRSFYFQLYLTFIPFPSLLSTLTPFSLVLPSFLHITQCVFPSSTIVFAPILFLTATVFITLPSL